MLTDQTDYQPSRRLFRIGKYLIPIEACSLKNYIASKPALLATFDDLAKDCPECLSACKLDEPESKDFELPVIHNGARWLKKIPGLARRECHIRVIRNSCSIGRNCCVLGPGNTAVAETGYCLDHRSLAQSMFLGKLNPRYWRYLQHCDLTTRRYLPPKQYVAGCAAILNNRSSHNYYHWLVEIAPRIAAIELAGLKPDFFLVDCQHGFQQQILQMLGISQHKWIQPHCGLNLAADKIVHVQEHGPLVIKEFVSLLAGKMQDTASGPDRKLYISRRKARHRKIVDELQLEQFLASRGFESHCFEDYSMKEQFRLIRQSTTIVTAHGAALANCMFAAPGTSVIELFPERRGNINLYPQLSHWMGLSHQTVLASCSRFRQQLRVNLSDLEMALDYCSDIAQGTHSTQAA